MHASPPSDSAAAAPFQTELRELARLAAPIVLTQLSMMALGFVDLVMVGHCGVDAVGAVSLGNLWKVGTSMVAMGLVLGIDPFVTQVQWNVSGLAGGVGIELGAAEGRQDRVRGEHRRPRVADH